MSVTAVPYPGKLALKMMCPKNPGGSQPVHCDQAKIDWEYEFAFESAFNYAACDKWVNDYVTIGGGLNTPEVIDSLKKQCYGDVCKNGCQYHVGVAGAAEINECVNQCNSGKRFNSACDFFITRNISNEVLANLGCGEQLKGIANIEAMKQAEANKLQAFDLAKKLLVVLLLFIVLFIAYKYL